MATLTQTARTHARWALEQATVRAMFAQGARRGEPLAQIEMNRAVREHPEQAWEQIRAAGRISRGRYVWVTTDHQITSTVLRADGVGVPIPLRENQSRVGRLITSLRDEWSLGPVDRPSLLALDAPEHTKLRKLVSRAFTPRRVAGMADGIEARATSLLDRLEGREQVDIIEEYAAHLPLAVIADLLGVPEDERGPLLPWGNAGAMLLDAGLSHRDYLTAIRGMRGLHEWFDRHIARLRTNPGDDLLSSVIQAADSSEDPPTETELRMLGLLVLGAGFETTVNLIGNAVHLLSAHPAQRDALVADPDGWGNAVEEVLRFDSPVQFNARTVHTDLELPDGTTLKRGAVVLMLLGAAHRDPAVWDSPNAFDVTRANASDHLAFSAGPHFCLGAGLARQEAVTGLRLLYARYPRLTVRGAGTRRTTRVLRGFEHLPVALHG